MSRSILHTSLLIIFSLVLTACGGNSSNERAPNSGLPQADNEAPVISVIESSSLTIEVGDTYNESDVLMLVSAVDNIDGDISANLQFSGDKVDTNTIGEYVVYLNVSDAAGNKAAMVTITINVVDTLAPVITLIGKSTVHVRQSDSYVEEGAVAFDNVDGDISDDIIISGDAIDTNTVGTYIITYNVLDQAGNAATEVTRTLNVVSTFRVSNTEELRAALYTASNNGVSNIILL